MIFPQSRSRIPFMHYTARVSWRKFYFMNLSKLKFVAPRAVFRRGYSAGARMPRYTRNYTAPIIATHGRIRRDIKIALLPNAKFANDHVFPCQRARARSFQTHCCVPDACRLNHVRYIMTEISIQLYSTPFLIYSHARLVPRADSSLFCK